MIMKIVFIFALFGAASSTLKYERTCDPVPPNSKQQKPDECSNYGNTVFLDKTLTNLEERLTGFQEDTRTQIDEIEMDVIKAKSDLSKQKTEISTLKKDVQRMSQHKENVDEKLNNFEETLNSTQRQLQHQTTKLEDLEQETDNAVKDAQNLIEMCKDELSSLNQTVQEFKGKAGDGLAVTKKELESSLKKIQNTSEDFSAKLSAQKDDIEKFKEDTEAKLMKLYEQLQERKKVEEQLKESINLLPKCNCNTTNVAFSAKLFDPNGLKQRNGENLILDIVLTNVGNAYNTKTGIFVAPLKGVYQFSFMTFGHSSFKNSGANLMKNGVCKAWTWESLQYDKSDTVSSTVNLQLNKGDKVNLRRKTYGQVYVAVFTGFLIFPL